MYRRAKCFNYNQRPISPEVEVMYNGMVLWVLAIGMSLVVLGIVLRLFRDDVGRQRQFLTALKEVMPGQLPEEINIVSSPYADWSTPSVRTIADKLMSLGFQRVGVFTVDAFPAVELYPMVSHNRLIMALITRLSHRDLTFFEVECRLEGGDCLSVVVWPLVAGPPGRPGVFRKHLINAEPGTALATLMAGTHGRQLLPFDPDEIQEFLREELESSMQFSRTSTES